MQKIHISRFKNFQVFKKNNLLQKLSIPSTLIYSSLVLLQQLSSTPNTLPGLTQLLPTFLFEPLAPSPKFRYISPCKIYPLAEADWKLRCKSMEMSRVTFRPHVKTFLHALNSIPKSFLHQKMDNYSISGVAMFLIGLIAIVQLLIGVLGSKNPIPR